MFFLGTMLTLSFVVALCGSVVFFQLSSPFIALGLLWVAWSLFPNAKQFTQAVCRGEFTAASPPTPPEPSLHSLRFDEIYNRLRRHYCQHLEIVHNRHAFNEEMAWWAEEAMRVVEQYSSIERARAVAIRRWLYDQIQYLLITQTSDINEIVDEIVGKGLRTLACWLYARNHWKIDPQWRTEAVVGLCQGQYEEAKSYLLPVIADALEDANCADPDVLAHCRSDIGDHQCGLCMLVLGHDVGVNLVAQGRG